MGSILDNKVDTIFTAIEHGKTFKDLASRYGLTVVQLAKELEAKVGKKKFRQLEKANERNINKKEKATLAKPVTEKPEEKEEKANMAKKATTKKATVETKKTENPYEGMTLEQVVKELEKAKRGLKIAEKAVVGQETLLKVEESRVEDARKELNIAQELVVKAKLHLEQAQKSVKNAEKCVNDKKEGREKWATTVATLEAKVLELEGKNVYLVAPGYKGELPKVGNCVSCVEMDKVTVESGTELEKEPTVMDLLNSGFKMISEALDAYNFAKLVIRYYYEEDDTFKVTVLVDDDRIKAILKQQGCGEF